MEDTLPKRINVTPNIISQKQRIDNQYTTYTRSVQKPRQNYNIPIPNDYVDADLEAEDEQDNKELLNSKQKTKEESDTVNTDVVDNSQSTNKMIIIIFAIIVVALVILIVWLMIKYSDKTQDEQKIQEEEMKERLKQSERNHMPKYIKETTVDVDMLRAAYQQQMNQQRTYQQRKVNNVPSTSKVEEIKDKDVGNDNDNNKNNDVIIDIDTNNSTSGSTSNDNTDADALLNAELTNDIKNKINDNINNNNASTDASLNSTSTKESLHALSDKLKNRIKTESELSDNNKNLLNIVAELDD